MVASCIALGTGCRAPLRGIDFGSDHDPYRYEAYVEPRKWSDEPVYRLILIGDAGQVRPDDPTLALLGHWGDEYPERTTVVYLGDNLYPAGLEDGDRARGESVLLQQIDATRAKKLMIPGNHDWGFSAIQMMATGVLGNQQAFVESQPAAKRVAFEPKRGCPGPIPLEILEPGGAIGSGLLLVVLDLHWWLLDKDERPVCDEITDTKAFVEELRTVLDEARGRNVVVVAHHPLLSGGTHGGFTRGFWLDRGAWVFSRLYSIQDLVEPNYIEMISVLSEILAESPPLAVVGGHDHSLQVLDGGDIARLVVVSGAGSQLTGVTALEETIFAHAHLGFVVFDFHAVSGGTAGALAVHVVETGRDDGPVFSLGIDLGDAAAAPEPVPESAADPEPGVDP